VYTTANGLLMTPIVPCLLSTRSTRTDQANRPAAR